MEHNTGKNATTKVGVITLSRNIYTWNWKNKNYKNVSSPSKLQLEIDQQWYNGNVAK